MTNYRKIGLAIATILFGALLYSRDREARDGSKAHSATEQRAKNQGKSGEKTKSISNRYFGVATSEIINQIRKGETLGGSLELLNMASHNVKSEADVLDIMDMLDALNASEANRSSVLNAAFGSLSKRGLTSEALALIDQNFGIGNLRDTLLLAVFAHSKLSVSNLIGLAESLDQEMEKNIAFGAISHVVSLNVSNLTAAELEFLDSSSQARETLGSGIAQALARPGQANNVKDAETIVHAFAHDRSFVSGFSKYATADSLEILWPNFFNSPDRWSDGSREEFLRANSRMQPQATVRKLAGWELAGERDIRSATQTWLESEPTQASSQLLTMKFYNSLARDNAMLEVVRYSMIHGETDSANGWIERIESDAIKSEASKLIGE